MTEAQLRLIAMQVLLKRLHARLHEVLIAADQSSTAGDGLTVEEEQALAALFDQFEGTDKNQWEQWITNLWNRLNG